MGRESPGFAADEMPLKRKSLQDLAEEEAGSRQCSTALGDSPISWMDREEPEGPFPCCNRKAPKTRPDGDAASELSGGAGCRGGTAMMPPLGMPTSTTSQHATPSIPTQPHASLLRASCGGACSMSVYCSSSFGALDEDVRQDSGVVTSSSSYTSSSDPRVASGSAAGAGGCCTDACLLSDPQWPELPDDILRRVLDRLPPSYLRVARLVCRQWEGAAGRLLCYLRPESLRGKSLGVRFLHLHSLDLSQCMACVEFGAPNRLRLQSRLTDDLLAELAPLSKLRELSLRNCNSITGTGLLHLTALPELRMVNLSNCAQLSDEGLACAAQLQRVETLNLQGCTSITDVGLMRLWGMPRLRHIICHNRISDVGLHILTGITGLERVALRDCRGVSTQGVMGLLQMPSLKRVVISKCPQVTLQSLCGVSNLRVVNDLAGIATAAAAGGGAGMGAAVGAGAAGAAALQHAAAAVAPAWPVARAPGAAAGALWQHNPAIMPDLHLLLADLA